MRLLLWASLSLYFCQEAWCAIVNEHTYAFSSPIVHHWAIESNSTQIKHLKKALTSRFDRRIPLYFRKRKHLKFNSTSQLREFFGASLDCSVDRYLSKFASLIVHFFSLFPSFPNSLQSPFFSLFIPDSEHSEIITTRTHLALCIIHYSQSNKPFFVSTHLSLF